MTMASRNAMRAIGQLVRRSKVRLAPKAVEVKPAEAAAAGAKPPCVFSTEAFGTSAEAFVPPFDLDLCRSEVRVNVGTAGRTPKQVRASSDMDWPLLGAEIERVDSDSPAAEEEGLPEGGALPLRVLPAPGGRQGLRVAARAAELRRARAAEGARGWTQ